MVARISLTLIALALYLLPVSAQAEPAGTHCGRTRLDAMAHACSELLKAQAHFLVHQDATARDRKHAGIQQRIEEVWAGANDPDPRCATWTGSPTSAFQRLAKATQTASMNAASPSCGRKFLRVLRRHCRQAVRFEATRFASEQDRAKRRSTIAERIRTRIARQWPARGCAAEPTVEQAIRTAFSLAGIAASEASPRSLRSLAREVDRELGVAIEPHEIAADATYAMELVREATSLTAENRMKWSLVHPTRNAWNFAPADAVVDLAESQGQRLRGHTLIWGAGSIPSYIREAASGLELQELMSEHIGTLVGRYAGRIQQWDVVNEPLPSILQSPTSDGLANNLFRRMIGPGYIAYAFELAHAADPSARLYLNENGIHLPGPRQDRFFALVEELLASGVPLHGVGFQAHIGLIPVGQYPSAEVVAQSIRRFTALGLDVELTELDISVVFRPGPLDTRLRSQAEAYRAIFEACLSVPRCTGVTLWGLSDRYTWLRDSFGFDDHPLPYDEDWERKPGYFGIRAAFLAAWLARE